MRHEIFFKNIPNILKDCLYKLLIFSIYMINFVQIIFNQVMFD